MELRHCLVSPTQRDAFAAAAEELQALADDRGNPALSDLAQDLRGFVSQYDHFPISAPYPDPEVGRDERAFWHNEGAEIESVDRTVHS